MASAERTVTWRELLAETAALLDDRGARTLDLRNRDVARRPTSSPSCSTGRPPSGPSATSMRWSPAHRTGEPIQYVLGSWGFRHLDLAVDRRVLIPRPETELVVDAAIELAERAGPIRTVADLGTGSGAIGLALADELPHHGTTVWITDASADALAVARDNLAGLGRAATNVVVAAGEWYDALPDDIGFDVIVSNPPYVADASVEIERIVEDWEPSAALFAGPDGLDDIRLLVAGAPTHLRPGGWLALEHGHDQGAAVRELMELAGLDHIETRTDLADLDRFTIGRRPSTLFAVPWPHGDLRVRHLHNTVSDYAHLLNWLATPEVLEWYEGRDKTFDLAAVLTESGPGGEHERNGTIPAIIELDGDEIGYVQLYELDDPADAAAFDLDDGSDIWSLDLYLGRPELFGQGIGRAVCRAVAEFMLAEWDARDVVILPYVDNVRAIAAYRAAGFTGDHVVREHELHEGVMRDALRLHFSG